MALHVFALTGGIGSGKSTVARHWRSLGLPVIDADVLAREVVAPGSPGLDAVIARFGPEVLTPDGELDRRRLGRIVFDDPAARADLEGILHPLVRRAAGSAFAQLADRGETLACYEVPLLFETGQQDTYRPVVVVWASPETQRERAATRDGVTPEAIQARIDSQLPLDEKAARADFVIDNDGPLPRTLAQAEAVLTAVRERVDAADG